MSTYVRMYVTKQDKYQDFKGTYIVVELWEPS